MSLQVVPMPLVARHESGPQRVFEMSFDVSDSTSRAKAILQVNTEQGIICRKSLEQVKSGKNQFEIQLPETDQLEKQTWRLTMGNSQSEIELQVEPVRQWHLHISLHSHTDLGFTGVISDVAAIHADNTDQAMTLIEETAHWPSESQFRWTMEVAWQLEQYLALRGGRAGERLKKYLRSGHIELTALYAGEHVDLLGHEEAARAFYLAAKYRREWQIPVDTAMLCDVPGSTEGLVQIMARSGISNFIIADNNFFAPLLARTDLPRPFTWESHSGDQVTTWYTDHPFFAYIEGRHWGISESIEVARNNIPLRLLEQEKAGYAHDLLHIQYAFDNFRLEFRPALVVREWNEKWLWPRLELSTPRRFFNAIRSTRENFPVLSGDLTEWWTGSFNRYPVEAAISKNLHDHAPNIETLSSLFNFHRNGRVSQLDQYNDIYNGMLAWDEHSGNGQIWLAEDPEDEKRALEEGYEFIYKARDRVRKQEILLKENMSNSFSGAQSNSFVVANSLNWSRGGRVYLEDLPANETICIYDQNGSCQQHSLQVNDSGILNYDTTAIPSLGYQTFEFKTQQDCGCDNSPQEELVQDRDLEEGLFTLSSEYLTVEVNAGTGEISRFETKLESLKFHDSNASGSLGEVQFWEAVLADKVEMGRYIRSSYEGVPASVNRLNAPAANQIKVTSGLTETRKPAIQIQHSINGHPWLSKQLSFDSTGKRLVLDYRFHHEGLFHESGVFELLDHQADAHGIMYIAFPLSIENASFSYESTGMSLSAGDNQFKGSNHDFYAVHRWAQLSSTDTTFAIYPSDAIIADPGEPAPFRFRNEYPDDCAAMYFRVTPSNGWEARNWAMGYYQQDLKLHFEIEGFQGNEQKDYNSEIARHGAELATRFVATRINPDANGPLNLGQGHLFEIGGAGLEVSTIKEAESADGDIIIRLREVLGQQTKAILGSPGRGFHTIAECQMTEEVISWSILEDRATTEFDFQPFEIKTIRFSKQQHGQGEK